MSQLKSIGIIGSKYERNDEIVDNFIPLEEQLHVIPPQGLIDYHLVFLEPAPDSRQNYITSLSLFSDNKS